MAGIPGLSLCVCVTFTIRVFAPSHTIAFVCLPHACGLTFCCDGLLCNVLLKTVMLCGNRRNLELHLVLFRASDLVTIPSAILSAIL